MLLETIWRSFVILLSVASLFILAKQFRLAHAKWSNRVCTYWYALFMWMFAAVCTSAEGIIRELPLRYTGILITAAAVATFVGLVQETERYKHKRERES